MITHKKTFTKHFSNKFLISEDNISKSSGMTSFSFKYNDNKYHEYKYSSLNLRYKYR